ncbi:MAG: mannitol dehydrogenase family protein [Cucumibacter sp.]
MTIHLSLAALPDLPADVRVPAYARGDLSPGILHFGVGNFHRAHQGVYLDELFSLGLARDWAVIGAGVKPVDALMREKLRAQDYLTTVIERDSNGRQVRVTGGLIDFIAPGDRAALIARLADPRIRIVSLTVTEGGYFINAAGRFDATHPDIRRDAENIAAPETVFGLILAGLIARRRPGTPPFTVMSCDNIPGNGDAAMGAVAGLAGLFDPALAAWVRGHVACPNSMVDRITPATTDHERALVAEVWGIEDNWPVACETFRQWVVEDQFPAGRPALEKVGVTFVADVAPYELMKIRILNGGHAAIAYPAGLLDIHFVSDAMAHPLIAGFLERLERDEIVPIVPPVPGVDLTAYFVKVAERFANPQVGDTVRRLCFDGSNRQPKFILPTAADRLARGAPVTGLALVSALWCRYCAGATESGAEIPPNDPAWDRLETQARAAKSDPASFLSMRDIFGDLATNPAYVSAFSKALASVWSVGTAATLKLYLAGVLKADR